MPGAASHVRAFSAALLLLFGCATVPPPATSVRPLPDQAFAAEGRISARQGAEAVTANFRWQHAPPRDTLELATPLGQTVAELSGDASAHFAQIQFADGKVMTAADWTALTQRALGFPLPVSGLAAWVRGGPHAASAREAETDAQGRVQLLRQDGWEIVYGYADAAARLPQRLSLTYPGVEVRLALDRLE